MAAGRPSRANHLLQEIFKKKLADAKAKVDEPAHQKLKLNMSAPKQQQSLKLRLQNRTSPAVNSGPNTPASRNSATPGVIIDNEALQRQQRHIQDSINGARPASSGTSQTPAAPRNPLLGAKSSAHPYSASPPAINGVKKDPQTVQSPALSSIRPASTTSDTNSQRVSISGGTTLSTSGMPPPQALSRPASGSPLPNGHVAQLPGAYSQNQPPNYYVPPVTPHFEMFRKVPLKSKH